MMMHDYMNFVLFTLLISLVTVYSGISRKLELTLDATRNAPSLIKLIASEKNPALAGIADDTMSMDKMVVLQETMFIMMLVSGQIKHAMKVEQKNGVEVY